MRGVKHYMQRTAVQGSPRLLSAVTGRWVDGAPVQHDVHPFRKSLADAVGGHRHVGEVRGDGLMAAVESVEDRDDRTFFDASKKVGPQIATALVERGVIGRAMPQGDILGFAPPLCLTREEADIVVGKTAEAVKAVLG